MTLAILFSLKSMELLENRLQPHSGATPLISMGTESQASSQSCHSVDADAWCKWALKVCLHVTLMLYSHWVEQEQGLRRGTNVWKLSHYTLTVLFPVQVPLPVSVPLSVNKPLTSKFFTNGVM